jgi:adenosylcobinamide-GDP ribazoletransferase
VADADVTVPRAGRDGGPVDTLVAAVAFLSRIPVAGRVGDRAAAGRSRTGASAFGLVGAALGLVAAVPLVAFGGLHPFLAAIAGLALLALLDGGLHLDGLADTFDALAAPGSAAERARTDPRAGTAGVIAIVAVLALDAAALAELAARGGWTAAATLIAAGAVSRAAAPAWAVLVGRRRRPQRGLGAWFAEATTTGEAFVAGLSAAALALLLVGFGGVLVALGVLAGIVVAAVAGGLVVRARHQLDGDGYGALIEITFAAVLVATALLAGPLAATAAG